MPTPVTKVVAVSTELKVHLHKFWQHLNT